MAQRVLKDVRFVLDGYEISSSGNSISVEPSTELLANDKFGPDVKSRSFTPGLTQGRWSFGGVMDYGPGNVEEIIHTINAAKSRYNAFAAGGGGSLGSQCHFFRTRTAEYTPLSANIGELQGFQLSGQLSGGLGFIPGLVLESGRTVREEAGAGLAVDLGAVPEGKRLYAAVHVLEAQAESTMDLYIESDSVEGFDNESETERFEVEGIEAIGSYFLGPIAGPVTDEYWRVLWEVDGDFRFIVAVGFI